MGGALNFQEAISSIISCTKRTRIHIDTPSKLLNNSLDNKQQTNWN